MKNSNATVTEITTSTTTIRLLGKNVLENKVRDNAIIDVEQIHEIKAANMQLCGGEDYVVLVDSGHFSTITKEARELSACPKFAQNTVAKALLVYSLGHRLVGEFYIKVNKPKIITKVFTDREKAISWLQAQL